MARSDKVWPCHRKDRISAPDFVEYKSPTFSQSDNFLNLQPKWKEQSYHLEQKDGSLKKFTINLKDNAEVILQGIADALKTTGMSVMKAPPNPDFKIICGSGTSLILI